MLMLQVDRRHSVLATYNCQDRPESSEKKPSMEEFPELEWPVRMSTRDCLNHKLLSSMSRWSWTILSMMSKHQPVCEQAKEQGSGVLAGSILARFLPPGSVNDGLRPGNVCQINLFPARHFWSEWFITATESKLEHLLSRSRGHVRNDYCCHHAEPETEQDFSVSKMNNLWDSCAPWRTDLSKKKFQQRICFFFETTLEFASK